MKKNIFLHAACIIVIILSVISVYLLTKPKIPLDDDLCKSMIHFKLDDDNHNFEYNIFITFGLTEVGKGYEHMRGVVVKDGKKYNLARTLDFSYKIRNNSHYEISVIDVRETGLDNIPADLVSKYLAYTLPNSFSLLKINEIGKNLILVSGLQGPVFICSVL